VSSRPLIGVSTYREEASWGSWKESAALVPWEYVSALVEAGAVPLLLPPIGGGGQAVAAVAALDALVLSGGADVEPARYGAVPHPRTARCRPDRDRWEIALLEAALERDLPVLGICRGAQLLNVALGGTLRQHVPDDVGHEGHGPAADGYGAVAAELDPAALPGRVLGPSVEVSCHHHQSVDALGRGVTVTGRAADGTVEAIEVPLRPFVCGVQWHPETGPPGAGRDLRLFEALVAAALTMQKP
jgi:putative glutamine amidotransferase